MICRIWHGWTPTANADAYDTYLKSELFPRLGRELTQHGYLGFQVLRLAKGSEVEFVTLVWFESLSSVRSFAGENYEKPVITAKAQLYSRDMLNASNTMNSAVFAGREASLVRGSNTEHPVHELSGKDFCPA